MQIEQYQLDDQSATPHLPAEPPRIHVEPRTYAEAVTSADSDAWKEAMPKLLTFVLGIQVLRTETGIYLQIYLQQEHYIGQVLERFHHSKANPEATPLDPSAISSLRPRTSTASAAECAQYGQLLGALNYLATRTRPDIATAIFFLARFMSNPAPEHWSALKRVLRYLAGTQHHGLHYPKASKSTTINAFSDSDWACSAADRHSITGYLICHGEGPIVWRSGRQSCIAQSSCEAEVMASTEACREIAWRPQIFNGIYINDTHRDGLAPQLLYMDNQGAEEIANDPVRLSKRSKHMELRHLYVRECVSKQLIKIQHVASAENLAVGFTKRLRTPAFLSWRDQINVREAPHTSSQGRGSRQDIEDG
ncbi:MAG: hypothetical protein BJ554DRAFT_6802 [Olpidium bornovanus]|uniref:Reverse transcriptase Ty1/copia-type domain-containing protein n=1 Tax=Olpidium bornovanus TaxID=278681 RepID=A0A8H8DJV3_9FUNG|nr:MAG: hypothetical protein BJ554DRAFT_6802 [Olpidium bornovanus]